MKNVGEILRNDADLAGIPLRTLEQVQKGLAIAKMLTSRISPAGFIPAE